MADAGKFCNHCQAPIPTGTSKQLKAVAGFAVAVISITLWAIVLSRVDTTPTASKADLDALLTANREEKAKAPVTTPNSEPSPKQNWSYSAKVDSMTGKGTDFAETSSTNTVDFGFPYAGEQHGVLMLRQHPRHGTSVILGIEKGQFLCVTGCSVTVRFDDKPARRFSASQPDDYSSTALFINSEKSFIAEAKKAKAIRIEAGFYSQGSRVFEFDIEGLKWPH